MSLFEQPSALGLDAAFNVKMLGKYLVVLQSGAYPRLNTRHRGRLLVIDPLAPAGKREIGRLEGIGSARQLTIRDTIAYVTAREDGLFLVDVSDPAAPRLLSHYNTVEFATGIAVENGLAVVSLRQYGLELIDVRDPRHPRFVSLIRTGEAQSVCIDGHCAYAGVWGSKELVIADIEHPERPRILARAPLDGRGDGVTVRKGICYAATGQHARPPKGVENPAPETYERLGNGLELWDVSDPARPKKISGVKFPPYYGLTFDMWDVQLSGDLALVSNTRNGLYAVDVSDPLAPRIVDSVRLPVLADGTREPITGFDFSGDCVALSGGEKDVYILKTTRPLLPKEAVRATFSPTDQIQPFALSFCGGKPLPYARALTEYNVYGLELDGNILYAACGEAGVLALNRRSMERLACIPTEGSAFAVKKRGEMLYVAEGFAGLAVYHIQGLSFEKTAAYSPWGRAVWDLQFSETGDLLLLQCASLGVALLDVSAPETPRFLGACMNFVGLFYGRHFPSVGWKNECFLGVNRDGCFGISAGKEGPVLRPLPPGPMGFGPSTGIERRGENLLLTGAGFYSLIPLDAPADTPIQRRAIVGAENAAGKPRLMGDTLVITERAEGLITLCRMEADGEIRAISRMQTTASPDLAVFSSDAFYIPGGHQGLLIFPYSVKQEEKT